MEVTYRGTSFPDVLQGCLQECADELEVNIRVMAADGLVISELQPLEDDTIDVYAWGSFSGPCDWVNIPREHVVRAGVAAEPTEPGLVDVLCPPAEASACATVSVGEPPQPIAQVRARRVALLYRPNQIRSDTFDTDRLIKAPLALSLDDVGLAAAEQRLAEENEARFLEEASSSVEREVQLERAEIAELERALVRQDQERERLRRELQNRRDRLDFALERMAQTNTEEHLRNEWRALVNHAKINELVWAGRTLHVYTDELEMIDPNQPDDPIPVGKFRITIDLRNNSRTVTNLTNRRGERDHPHVVNGDFCAGEIGPTLSRLIQERRIGAAVNLAITSLQRVNPDDDWGRYVEWWRD